VLTEFSVYKATEYFVEESDHMKRKKAYSEH